MDVIKQVIQEKFQLLIGLLETWLDLEVLTQDVALQLIVLAILIAVAVFAHRALYPRADKYLLALEVVSAMRRLLRAAAQLIGISVFLVLCLFAVAVMQDMAPETGASVLTMSLSLALAWAVIRLSASLIVNRTTARIIAGAAWAVAALEIIGFLRPILRAMDSVGFSLGASRVTLLALVNGALMLAVLLWAALFLASLLSHRLQASTTMAPRTQVLIAKLTKFVLIVLAGLIGLSIVGVNFAALAVFTGALGVGIGIGLQHQVSNLISGLFLLLDKSIKPGDVIEVDDTYGWVKEMSARYVGVVTRDSKEILIPNDTFVLNQVVNWSHSDRNVRLEVTFGVDYASDPHNVRRLAAEAARASKRVAAIPAPICHLKAFGESSLDFTLRFWISDPENGVTNVKGEILLALWDAFKANNIAIPYPHRHILFSNAPPSAPKDDGE